MTLNSSTATQIGTVNAFTINGGGATFQLASKVDIGGKVALGVKNIAARKLGNSDVGFLNSLAAGKANNVVDGNLPQGQKIVAEAIRQISSLRGRLGAFQKNTVGATIRSLSISLENSTAGRVGHPRRGLRQRDGSADSRSDPLAGQHQRSLAGQPGSAGGSPAPPVI